MLATLNGTLTLRDLFHGLCIAIALDKTRLTVYHLKEKGLTAKPR